MIKPPQQMLDDADAAEREIGVLMAELTDAVPRRLIDAMAYGVMGGGKRLRAALVLGAARLAQSEADTPNITDTSKLRVAAAWECLHGYSLIHDDLPAMDDAPMRRGKPSCHLAFDEATAILAGDGLQSLAFGILIDEKTHSDPVVRAALVAELAAAAGAQGMVGGQMLDIEAESRPFTLTETQKMQAMKTGALIKSAAVAGGIIGGSNDRLLAGLAAYAQHLGLAFQIADDGLDASGDSLAAGKPTGQDKKAGKATFIDLMGAGAAAGEAKRLITEANESLRNAVSQPSEYLDYMTDLACFSINRNH